MNIQNEIRELEGYCELGMAKEALALARKLLRQKNITAQTFDAVMTTILIQADHLKRWRRSVEAAFENLPLNARANVTDKLFHFYVSISDWNSAFSFLPKKPASCVNLLFCMWTFLELRKMDEAKATMLRCRRVLKHSEDELAVSALTEAMASYFAQAGDWFTAAKLWTVNSDLEIFASNAWEGLIKLHAYYALLQANVAFDYIKDEEFWDVSTNIMLPGMNSSIQADLDKQFHRMAGHLAKVIPAKERWKFGR